MILAEVIARGAYLRWYAILGGLLKLNELAIVVDPKIHDSPRHFAACAEDVTEIRIAPQLANLPEPIIDGILMHELGHAADFAYRGRLAADTNTGGRPTLEWRDRPIAQWKRRTPHHVEVAADFLAEAIFDVRIGYVGDLMLQSTAGGIRPRPFGL